MKELMSVDVVQAGQDLVEDALDTFRVHTFVISSFHQLVQVAVHVLHADVEFPAVGVEENIQGRHKVDVSGECSQEDDFS